LAAPALPALFGAPASVVARPAFAAPAPLEVPPLFPAPAPPGAPPLLVALAPAAFADAPALAEPLDPLAPAPDSSSLVDELHPARNKPPRASVDSALTARRFDTRGVFAAHFEVSSRSHGMRRLMPNHRGLKSYTLCSLLVVACERTSSPPPKEPFPPPPVAAPASAPVASAAPAPAASDAPSAVAVSPAVAAAVGASDRTPEDRALDAGRKPDQMLSFFGIAPGMRVAEIAAGGGYTSELLARTVGPSGKVYGQNIKLFLQRFAEKPWSERLAKPVMANVVRVDREVDDPLPPDAKNLDAVLSVLIYHDTVWLGANRERMNKAIFDALEPGGIYGIVDHSGRDGTDATETQTLHRIEEKVVKDEVTRAGFVLDAEANFLRNPADTRDWSASPRVAGERRGTSDRFVLRFKKPG
jgi:predicted methyltransferase